MLDKLLSAPAILVATIIVAVLIVFVNTKAAGFTVATTEKITNAASGVAEKVFNP